MKWKFYAAFTLGELEMCARGWHISYKLTNFLPSASIAPVPCYGPMELCLSWLNWRITKCLRCMLAAIPKASNYLHRAGSRLSKQLTSLANLTWEIKTKVRALRMLKTCKTICDMMWPNNRVICWGMLVCWLYTGSLLPALLWII